MTIDADTLLAGIPDRVECENGHELLVSRAGSSIGVATRNGDLLWEFVDVAELFCPTCGGDVDL